MALGCGQVDLRGRGAASETSSLQSSSQKPGTRNRGLASCFFLTMAPWRYLRVRQGFVCM